VKAGLELVPWIGGALATLVGDIADRRRERVLDFAEVAIELVGDASGFLARLQANERVADMFVQAAFSAAGSSFEPKRRAMGRVVGQAATDDAQIDMSQLLIAVLIDLEAPHFHALGALAAARDPRSKVAADDLPWPVVAGLQRHGLIETMGTYNGGTMIKELTPFGRQLLDYVTQDT